MSRAATAYDAAPILDPTPEIAAAVRAYRALSYRAIEACEGYGLFSPEYNEACDDRWASLRDLEDAIPTGAWFLVDRQLWGWAKRSRHGGLAVVSEPVACPWPRREE